jgi:ATP-binding cassette subfamily B protein
MLGAAEMGQGYCLQITGQRFVAYLRKMAFQKLQRLSMAFLDMNPIGKLMTRMSNDAESVAEMFSMGAVQIIGDLFFLAGTLIMLFIVDIKLSLYAALIFPFLALGIYLFRHYTKKAFLEVRTSLSNLNIFLEEYLSGIATVQMAGQLKNVQDEFSKRNDQYLWSNSHAVFLDAAVYSFVDAMSYIASALVLWGAFRLKLEDALSLGVLIAFIEALTRFFQPLREISNRYAIFQSALVSLNRIYELFSWPEEHSPKLQFKDSFNQSIEFKNVSFSYKAEGPPVLKNISFILSKGQHIALVGQTGAGKSSVFKLLSRFYPVSQGAILIDGQDLNELSLLESRKLISAVPQEIFLFQGTLRENLRFGNELASDSEIWQALKAVQMFDVVTNKGGLDLMLEAKGKNFSHGERQLLAFARTLLVDPPILILDEATASVDRRTEKKLKEATEELLKKRTALIIAHRLSTVEKADCILVFQHGQIIEEGTHQSLLAKSGSYALLYRSHFLNNSASNSDAIHGGADNATRIASPFPAGEKPSNVGRF